MTALQTLTDARKQLQEDGQLITFERYTETVYDPTTGKNTATLELSYQSYGYPSRHRYFEVSAGVIETSDVRLVFSVPESGAIPKRGDSATFNDIAYRIQQVQPISESGVTVLYILHCKV